MSPVLDGIIRGIIAGILIGAAEALRVYVVDGQPMEQAVARGFMFAIPVWIGLTGYGAFDQYRVANGIISPSDVPVQIEAKRSGQSPTSVARDMAPKNVR